MSTPDNKQAEVDKTSAEAPSTTATRMRNVPNALTILRLIMVPIFGVLLLMHGGMDPTLRWWAFAIFLVAMFTDKLDGDIARKYNIVSNFGKLADPIADKALMAVAFIGLAIIQALPWWVPVVILVREIGITVLRMFMLKYEVMPASRGGKLKTVLQTVTVALYLAALPLSLITPAGFMFVYAVLAGMSLTLAVVVTLVTGVDYVLQARKIKAEAQKTGSEKKADADAQKPAPEDKEPAVEKESDPEKKPAEAEPSEETELMDPVTEDTQVMEATVNDQSETTSAKED